MTAKCHVLRADFGRIWIGWPVRRTRNGLLANLDRPTDLLAVDRRGFFAGAAAVVTGAATWRWRVPDAAVPPDIRFGYAALSWRGDDRSAIDDIAALGFRGIQLRLSALREWGERPEELRSLLAARRLTMVALSSGLVRLDPAHETEDLALHLRNARFVRDVGGLYLQVVDERPRGRAAAPADYVRMGRLLTELGRRTADIGIALGYHNHMGNLGQSPEEVARVLDAADPRFVRLELDTAHYRQAGGDPAAAVREYAGRLLFLHLKDVVSPAPEGAAGSYRFVELGRGTVDFPALFAALADVRFAGWAIVELDPVPDAERTPKESGVMSRAYLQSLGFTI